MLRAPRPQAPAQPPVQPPPLPPDTGRAVPGAGDPYPALVATPLDGAACRPSADFGAQPARRGATGERAYAVVVAIFLTAVAQSVRHRRQCVSHAVLPDRHLRRRGLRDRQAALRSGGPAGRGPGRQRAARRHPRHRRSADARRRDRPAVSVHRRRADVQGAARPEIRRVPLRQRREPARRGRHHHRRQGGAARLHRRRGADLRPDRAAAHRKRRAHRQHPRRAARGHAAAGDLSLHPRHDARADHPAACSRTSSARAAGGLGAPQSRPADPHAGAARDARLDHREGDRQAGGAHARRRGVRQPAAAEDEAAIRSDHHLRPGRRQRLARPADHAQRDRAADALQHLRDRRAAARTDRQSGPRLARSRRQSGAHQGTVLRRRRHRRSCLLRHLRAAPAPCGAAARDRAAGARRGAARARPAHRALRSSRSRCESCG